ncbi:Light-mediated development protein DET1 [Platanthera guangdongensis]|uniref:Light-mediated development protein DET1 n=1 Tax=Platanthera guangdongensis TaxID=2320717 RepID=A0ABR2MFC5_9ASPA
MRICPTFENSLGGLFMLELSYIKNVKDRAIKVKRRTEDKESEISSRLTRGYSFGNEVLTFSCSSLINSFRIQHLKKKFYFHFQDYVDLIMWKSDEETPRSSSEAPTTPSVIPTINSQVMLLLPSTGCPPVTAT